MVSKLNHWLLMHIGALEEASQRHARAVIVLAALTIIVEPGLLLTVGSGSILGVGMSLTPEQEIPLGLVVFSLLIVRLIWLWVTALIASGTDQTNANTRVAHRHGPEFLEPNNDPQKSTDPFDDQVNQITFRWELIRIYWQFVIPNVFALAAITFVLIHAFWPADAST